jgi:hypothetical protein
VVAVLMTLRLASLVQGRARIPALVRRTILLLVLVPGVAVAQSTPPPSSSGRGHPWIVGGGSATTLLGDCTDCPADTYIHSGGVLAIIGGSLTHKTDVGGELFWVPATTASGDYTRTMYVMGTFQFRPWQSSGFFMRVGSGMAFVRNWLGTVEEGERVFTSKAFAIGLGAGWEWRLAPRLGAQVFGTQHAAALGDLTGNKGRVENVMGNFWSVGAAVVIR